MERIRIARTHVRIIAFPVDLISPQLRVLLGQQPLHRLFRREVRIAVVEVPIGEGQVHGLVEHVDVARTVVAHRLQIEVLEDVEDLVHDRPLGPLLQLVDLDAFVRRHHRLFDVDLPVGEVLGGDAGPLLAGSAHVLLRDISAVEAVVGGHDRFLATLSGGERVGFSLDELPERRGQV